MIVLSVSPRDKKALFRRCQAYSELNNLEKSMEDIIALISLEPENNLFMEWFDKTRALIEQQKTTKQKIDVTVS